MTWYEVSLKLRLPELISQNSSEMTVLENLVVTLIKESSIRTRRQPEVVIEGLATLPRPISLPSLTLVPENGSPTNDKESEKKSTKQRRPKSGNSGLPGTSPNVISTGITKTTNLLPPPPIIVKRATDLNFKTQKASVENWIPEVQRMKSLHRDLIILKENVNDIVMREVSVKRETKQFLRSDLQKAEDEMSLEMTKKIPCGCCLQPFLYVNLPLKVSQKAIVDIRVKWSGGLNSSTIFEGIQSLDPDLNPFFSTRLPGPINSSGASINSGSTLSSNGKLKEELSLRRVPLSRIYEEVRVCVFCAQFFQDQESYRPSFHQIVYEEKRAAHLEARRRELEYWDPLKMCEKDRERAVFLQMQAEAEAAASRAEQGILDDEHHDATSSMDGAGQGGGND